MLCNLQAKIICTRSTQHEHENLLTCYIIDIDTYILHLLMVCRNLCLMNKTIIFIGIYLIDHKYGSPYIFLCICYKKVAIR